MKRFIEGEDRSQSTLFPERLEDWINEDNPVRVIDVFVDELDLGGLGFGRVAVLIFAVRNIGDHVKRVSTNIFSGKLSCSPSWRAFRQTGLACSYLPAL